MKAIILSFVLLVSTGAFSQHNLEKNIGAFSQVKVFDLIKISLIKSDENKVVISGEDVDDVEIINKNGILKIRMKLERIFDGTATFVAVHYTTLDVIDGNEGAIIVGNELISQESIELRAQEGANLIIGLDVISIPNLNSFL